MGEQHTPGPWTLLPRTFSPRIFVMPANAGADTPAIADVRSREDARLIAAAPELLKALKAADDFLTKRGLVGEMPAIIRAAIAKATPAPDPIGREVSTKWCPGLGPVNCQKVLMWEAAGPYPRTCERCGLGPCPFWNADKTRREPSGGGER